MMNFQRFYEHFLFCSAFFAQMKQYPEQERGLMLIGAAMRKFEHEARLVAMNDVHGSQRNIVIVVARHRPPFWNASYTNALAEAIGGGDIDAAYHKVYTEWGLLLRIEFSQSARGPADFMYPNDSFPVIAKFDPNWEKIYDTICDIGFTFDDIEPTGVRVGMGTVLMKNGRCVALGRGCYKLPPEDARENAKPAENDDFGLEQLRAVHVQRRK